LRHGTEVAQRRQPRWDLSPITQVAFVTVAALAFDVCSGQRLTRGESKTMEGSGDVQAEAPLASKETETVPDLGSVDNGAALDAELDFVASFMMALTQGVPKGKEDKDLIRQRKERKRQINRASAKRKRARAKQEFDDLATQCHQREESNRQLKNDNARLAGVMRDELEKQAMYMAQIEYIKAALQQQQAVSLGGSRTDASEPGTATGASVPSTSVAPPAPPPTPQLQSPPELQPSYGATGASAQQALSRKGQAREETTQGELSRPESAQEQHPTQQQELSTQSSQQHLQALASLICAAAMPNSQVAVNSTVPGSSGEASSFNQETLNQLQTLLTALASQNPVASSNLPAAPTAFNATPAAPPPVQNPLSADARTTQVRTHVAMNSDSAPQLHSFLSALAAASASLTGNGAIGGQPSSATASQAALVGNASTSPSSEAARQEEKQTPPST
jgi:hypothetical protein